MGRHKGRNAAKRRNGAMTPIAPFIDSNKQRNGTENRAMTPIALFIDLINGAIGVIALFIIFNKRRNGTK